mmetsp:Transcript_38115/g.89323  ORF Transcript_38115/g.89323 Transcript_38115/m.89323 type:complete len:209 (+) Transcript_38115:514-1140(+)
MNGRGSKTFSSSFCSEVARAPFGRGGMATYLFKSCQRPYPREMYIAAGEAPPSKCSSLFFWHARSASHESNCTSTSQVSLSMNARTAFLSSRKAQRSLVKVSQSEAPAARFLILRKVCEHCLSNDNGQRVCQFKLTPIALALAAALLTADMIRSLPASVVPPERLFRSKGSSMYQALDAPWGMSDLFTNLPGSARRIDTACCDQSKAE